MIQEVRRITCTAKDTLRADLKHSWKETARKVLKQARLEAAHNKCIASILRELPEEDELDGKGDIHACTVELLNCKFFPLWAGYVFLNAWVNISCAYVHVLINKACQWIVTAADFFLTDDGMSLLALVLLPHLLPDVRSKPDPNRIVYFTQVCVALSDAACLAYITFVPRPSHSSIFYLQY